MTQAEMKTPHKTLWLDENGDEHVTGHWQELDALAFRESLECEGFWFRPLKLKS